jgi:multidrug resistance efflux pump
LKMREALELKTPLGGVVSHIQRWPGEVVDVNDPILTIAQLQATQVVAYTDEDQVDQIREGMAVRLVKSSGRKGQSERSQVVSVGPAVVQKPAQLWRNPNIPERGRPFVVRVPPQMKLIIGERVGIRTL